MTKIEFGRKTNLEGLVDTEATADVIKRSINGQSSRCENLSVIACKEHVADDRRDVDRRCAQEDALAS